MRLVSIDRKKLDQAISQFESRAKFAEFLGVSDRQVRNYLNRSRVPKLVDWAIDQISVANSQPATDRH